MKDVLTDEKRARYRKAYTDRQLELKSQCLEGASELLLAKAIEDRCVCGKCGVLVVNKEIQTVHNDHGIKRGLTNYELKSPTTLLRPQDDNNGQAVRYVITSGRYYFYNDYGVCYYYYSNTFSQQVVRNCFYQRLED